MRHKKYLVSSIGLTVAIALGFAQHANSGTINAISAASFTFNGGTSTSTSATIKCSHTQGNGVYRFYYDKNNHTAINQYPSTSYVQGRIGSSSTVTGLTANTTYYFWAQGYDGSAPGGLVTKAKATGSFKTDAAAGIHSFHIDAPEATRSYVDPMGRKVSSSSDRNFSIQLDRSGVMIQAKD